MAEVSNTLVAVDYQLIITISVIVGAVATFVSEIIKHGLQKIIEYYFGKKAEEHKFEIEKRKQAARVAEFFALADISLIHGQTLSPAEVAKFNQLSYEMFLWIPNPVTVKTLSQTLDGKTNALEVLLNIRKVLNENNNDLTVNDIYYLVTKTGS